MKSRYDIFITYRMIDFSETGHSVFEARLKRTAARSIYGTAVASHSLSGETDQAMHLSYYA